MESRSAHRRTYNGPGHAHELTFCCFQRFPFLKSDRTCEWLAESIEAMRVRLDVALWSYVFMHDHVHLIVFPRRPVYDIPSILKAIKLPVGRRAIRFLVKDAPEWIPRISRCHGDRIERHFWQPGGGYDRNITEPATLRAMMEYIHLNPVRRGLVERAGDWRWSSAAWYEGRHWGDSLVPDPIPPEWTD